MKKNQGKYHFLFFSIFLSFTTFGQQKQSAWLTLGYDGFVPKVFEIEGSSAADLYNKAYKWAKLNYLNFEEELVLDSVNYKIKIRSVKAEAFYIGLTRNLFDVDYNLILSFKEGRYRVEVEFNRFFYNPRNVKYRAGGENQETGWDQKYFYETINGERIIIKNKSTGHSGLSSVFYNISNSLLNAMNQKAESTDENSDDNW